MTGNKGLSPLHCPSISLLLGALLLQGACESPSSSRAPQARGRGPVQRPSATTPASVPAEEPHTASVADDPESVRNRQRLQDILLKMHQSSLRRIRLKGDVVDEPGERLTDVTATVEVSGEAKQELRRVLRDGRFDFDFRDVTGMEVLFYKKGYYSAQLQVFSDPELTGEQWFRLMQGGTLKAADVEGEVQVVLEKQGQITKLDRYGATHSVGAAEAVLADFGKPPPPVAKGFVEPVKVDVVSPRPADGLVVVMEADERGAPAIKQLAVPPTGWGRAPAGAKLVMTAKGAGFVPYQPAAPQRAAVEMRRAPEQGYEREMTLTDDHYARLARSATNKAYFFFKTGDGRFGRGCLYRYSADPDESRVIIGVDLLVQPDKSRNLETGETWPARW